MSTIPQMHLKLVEVMKVAQIGMGGVIRWKKYVEKEQGCRVQNTLEHSLAQIPLGGIGLRMMKLDQKVDEGLLHLAFSIHDIGEGILKEETLYIDKSYKQDLREYLAFKHVFESLPEFEHMRRAFLLQFCRENPDVFPDDAREVMRELKKTNELEAIIFDALERLEYLLFGLEHYNERDNEMLLTQVLRNQVPHYKRLLRELPGFERIWTPALEIFCEELLVKNEGKWEEKKGEK